MNRIIRIATSGITVDERADCDVYIQPDVVNGYNTFDVRKIDELYQLGYAHAKKFEEEFLKLKEIKQE